MTLYIYICQVDYIQICLIWQHFLFLSNSISRSSEIITKISSQLFWYNYIKMDDKYETVKLCYTVHKYSSYSANYIPEYVCFPIYYVHFGFFVLIKSRCVIFCVISLAKPRAVFFKFPDMSVI